MVIAVYLGEYRCIVWYLHLQFTQLDSAQTLFVIVPISCLRLNTLDQATWAWLFERLSVSPNCNAYSIKVELLHVVELTSPKIKTYTNPT